MRNSNTDEFNSILGQLNNELEAEGHLNLLSQIVHAEEFYKRVLNDLYGWNLKNSNETDSNAEAIDLIDEQNRLIVQVTVSCTTKKVNSTLGKSAMQHYSEDGYRLKFVFAGKQDAAIRSKRYTNKHGVRFEASNDILFTSDLVRTFMYMDVLQQEEVLHVAKQETGRSFLLTKELIEKCFENSKEVLGSRYMPELTVPVDEMDYYKALIDPGSVRAGIAECAARACRDLSELEHAGESGKKGNEIPFANDEMKSVSKKIESLMASSGSFTYREVSETLAAIDDLLFGSRSSSEGENEDKELKQWCDKIQSIIHGFRQKVLGSGYELLGKSVVVLTGTGGIGKSHFMADLCAKAIDKEFPAFLFLGQEFTEASQPLQQMIRHSAGEATQAEFLSEICRFASTRSARAIIAIDGLNEGIGKKYWINHLQTLVNVLKDYQDMLLVVSVRTPYEESVIPESLRKDEQEYEIELQGFDFADDAVSAFCSHYGIESPAMPPFEEEFRSPLYLRILCEAMRKKGIGRFTLNLSFSEAAGIYIDNVNRKLAGPQCLGYGSRTNVVRIALDSLVSQQRFIDWGYLEYEEAEAAVRGAVRDYIDRPAEMMRWLEEEDLIRVQGGYGSAYVHFSYERVGDCVAAEHLLREVSQGSDVLGQLKSDESISAVISSNRHAGIVEALSVLVPERFGVEIFELFDEAGKAEAADYFISSLSWRSPSEVTDATAEYVRDIILPNPGLLVALITKLIAVSMSPNNAFNACYLHRLLKEMDPAARDAVWSRALLRSAKIEQTVDWIWRNVGSIPESAIWPVELLLCWCLASSSRNIRDVATKALSCCLIAAPKKAEDLLGEFLACQDDYVVERLLASIYGAASNSQDASTWFVAAKKIYEFVYEGAETYPNVMIRNYSDCLADHISKLMDLDENAFPLSRSRGTSSWYPQEVSNEHIDARLEETKQKYGENSEEAYNLWWLIHSMTTEYGRGTSAYGDFGRYVFGSRVRCWDNQFEIDQELANLALWEILENRYVPELHYAFDREVNRYEQGRGRGFERITKKYQWIEMHRVIARLLDNYPPYREEVLYDDEYNVYQKKRSALFMEAFRAKGGGYPSGVDLGPELDASEHVASLTKIPLSAEEVFNDLAYIRDIDPTYLFPDAESATEVEWPIAGPLSALSGDDSFDETTLKPVLDEVYTEERFGRSFTPLYAIVTKKNVSERTSEVHLNSGACFIKAADLVGFLEKYQGKNGDDIMSQGVYSIYAHEFCSGFALDMEQEFRLREMPEEEKQAIPATMEYLWEPVEDGSLDGETARLQQPCKDFVDCLGLVQDPSGTWKSGSGETVCINESTEEGNQMLVDHAWLKRYLSERELLLCRGEYFEISSPDECQRVWLVSAGDESAERTARLLKKEQYETDKSSPWYS